MRDYLLDYKVLCNNFSHQTNHSYYCRIVNFLGNQYYYYNDLSIRVSSRFFDQAEHGKLNEYVKNHIISINTYNLIRSVKKLTTRPQKITKTRVLKVDNFDYFWLLWIAYCNWSQIDGKKMIFELITRIKRQFIEEKIFENWLSFEKRVKLAIEYIQIFNFNWSINRKD